MNLPDRIFAVGGAGKEITLRLLEADWVLEDILKPRPNPHSVTITVIDTAEGEENTDKQRLQSIRNRIESIESDLRDSDQGRTGTIDIQYKLITEDIQLSGSIDLLGDDAVPRITSGTGMEQENWWIKENHINENLDFAKGVVRKRGLGKAIYYKAYAEDNSISSYIDLPDKGKVAVIAGLGGGTGSGILIDLARHLQQRQRTAEITLFGVMPNHTEGIKENTNAFAALSELEYVSLEDENIFKDIVLLPIDPTDFDGKTGNRIQTGQHLREFDEAAIYLIAAYYNTEGLEDPFAGTPKYAPFTIGIPQVLRYNVEAINEARDAIREILTDKEEALDVEEEIYSEVERFLTKHYDVEDVEPGLRDLDIANLTERIEEVDSFLDFDLFNELDYHSLDVFQDILEDARSESEDIIEQIELVSASLRAVDATGQESATFVDNIDENLAQILERDLRLVAQRKKLLEQRKVIEDNRIRDAVEYLIKSGNTNAAPGVKLQRIEAQLEDLSDQRERLEEELESVESELESAKSEQSDEVERLTSEWFRASQEHIEKLQTIDVDELQHDLNTLTNELDSYVQYIVNAESPDEVETADSKPISSTLDSIQDTLTGIGIQFQSQRQAIEGSLSQLKKARIAFLKLNQEEGTLERLTPWQSSTEEDKQQAHKDYQMQKSKLANNEVIEIGPPGGQFSADILYDSSQVIDDVHQKREQLQEDIVAELRTRVDSLPEEHQRSLQSILNEDNPSPDQLRETVRNAFWEEIGETEDIEAEKEEIETKLDHVQCQIEKFDPTISLFQNLNNRRDVWTERTAAFRSKWEEYEDQSEQSVSTQDEDYVYVKNVQPEDVFRATGNETIADSDFFNSREENQRVRNNLEELSKNARNQQYTGLRRRKLSKGRTRYDELKVRLAVLSDAVGHIDNDAIDFEETFSGAFDLGGSGKRTESPYTSWAAELGGPWDIGLTVFIDGVFLDNIRKVVQADGYYNGYRNRESEIGDDILVHHSYGLEDGYFVRRTDLLNMEYDDDVDFYLRDESDIVDNLLEDYYERVDHTKPTDSTED